MTPHPQRCEHYPICYYVRDRKENKISECYLCIADDPYLKMVCGLDTRSHSFAPTEQSIRRDERDKVLKQSHEWFNNYCEGNQVPDLWMAFLHAERALRTAAKDGE